MTEYVYKLRDKNTGLFLTGKGYFPLFNKTGKIYAYPRYAKIAAKTRKYKDYDTQDPDFEIVKYELTEVETMEL